MNLSIGRGQAGWLAGWLVGRSAGSVARWLAGWAVRGIAPSPPPSSPSPFRRLRLQGYRVFSFSISLSLSPSFASFRETLALTTALLSRPNQFPSNIFLLFQLLFNSCKAREGNRGGILIYIYITSLLFFLPPCTLFFFFFFPLAFEGRENLERNEIEAGRERSRRKF